MSNPYMTEFSPDNNSHVYQVKDKEAAPIDLLKDTVGWVGKNLLKIPASVVTRTINGVTFTVNGDGSITVNGTASDNTPFIIWGKNASIDFFSQYKGDDFTFSGGHDGVEFGSQSVQEEGVGNYSASGNEVTITVRNDIESAGSNLSVKLLVRNGVTVSNVRVYPMLRDASIMDSTFEPYHESVEEWGYTREEAKANGAYNLLDHNMKTHTGLGVTFTVNSDKSISLSGTSSGDIQNSVEGGFLKDISYLPYGKYKLTGCPSGGSSSTYRLTIANAASNTFISDTGEGLEFEINANTTWKYLYIRANSGVNLTGKVYKPMITRDMVATYDDYVPYAMTNKELTDSKFDRAEQRVLGAKNLFHYPYRHTTKTENGITFTDNGDGSVTVSGTATDNALYALDNQASNYEKGLIGDYIMSGGHSGVNVEFYRDGGFPIRQSDGIDKKITLYSADWAASWFYFGIVVPKNTVISTPVTVYPMLRLASDPDDTYVPYAMTNRELTEDRYYHAGDTVNVSLFNFSALCTNSSKDIRCTIPLSKNVSRVSNFTFKNTTSVAVRKPTGGYVIDALLNTCNVTMLNMKDNFISFKITKTDDSAFDAPNNCCLDLAFTVGSNDSIITFS